MTHELRPYQAKCVDGVIEKLNRSPILVAPTGSGKTTMGVHAVKRIAETGQRVCWIAHRTELIDQAVERFHGEGVSTGVIKAGVSPSPLMQVQVASVQTLVRRDYEADVYVIDEAHRAMADSYRNSIPRHAPVIGLTATPVQVGRSRTRRHVQRLCHRAVGSRADRDGAPA